MYYNYKITKGFKMEELRSLTHKVVVSDGQLRELFVDYVGNKIKPENDEVTIGMIIQTLAEEFPEVLLAVAEENYLRGYDMALEDLEALNNME